MILDPRPASAADALTPVEHEIIEHFFTVQPSYAVQLGLHDYDGRLPDLRTSATDAWATRSDQLLRDLAAISPEQLSAARRMDSMMLRLLLESVLFDLRDSLDLDRNPMTFVSIFSMTSYMVREYAPAARRIEAILHVLEQVPSVLTAGRQRLRSSLPRPFLQLTLAIGGGLPAHFAEAETFARRASSTLGDRVKSARPAAEEAITDFLARIKAEFLPKANDAFALGPAHFQRLLWVREGIEAPFAEVLAAGQADLRRNQARLQEIARTEQVTVPQLLERLYGVHPTATALIPTAQRFVDEARLFVENQHLATIPTPAICRVEETPIYGRALTTASMNPPGPFDTVGDEGIYYVTPVDPAWTPAKQEEWLRSLNDSMLRNITIHEVYPGHYLQFLHFRKSAGSLTRKVYLSSSFCEGWAHYAEQLAIEQNLGQGHVEAEVAQLHDALLRDCRLIASVGLHAQGMTLPQATKLFQQEAYFEELPAEREAIRGTYNPEYFCYTLGKLAILDVRSKHLQSRFRGSLPSFHDTLLGFGCPPIGLLDALLAGG
ncbi:MAG: DUF885 domain-containing protein [Thermoplasmata archaeon]